MEMSGQCPVSDGRVNEKATRLTAFVVVLSLAAFLVWKQWWIGALLTADFLVRAFINARFSPAAQLACLLVKLTRSEPRMVNAAPKKFAAAVGFVLCLALTALAAAGLVTAARAAAGIVALCAALEAFFGFCVGCKVYAVAANIKRFGS